MIIILLSIVGVVVGAFAALWKIGPLFRSYLLPPTVQEYGENTLSIMDSGLYASKPEWQEARKIASDKIARATSYAEANKILRDAIAVAGGKHSNIVSADEIKAPRKEYLAPTVEISNKIVTVTLPELDIRQNKGQEYADTIASALDPSICGVVLDLRQNQGGDMGPMLAGLSPLLPDGDLTSFVFKENVHSVNLKDGHVTGGGSAVSVKNTTKLSVPIAILTGPDTASSGEQTLLAFRGLDNVKVFGQPTAGFASVNQSYPLYNGSLMILTIGESKTRTGETFGDSPIIPDFEVPLAKAAEQGLDWLKQKGC
ncbi:MAG: peptidase S41 [Actinomycetales bacterium]|nr:MAG: peptidase S41 [Actinomycetales bacterium]